MTQHKESVATASRFASGLTWAQYLDHIKRNREKFEYNYAETVLSEDEAAEFRRLAGQDNGPAKVLALGEDWCPDVFRGIPVMARIAEAAAMELRIFPRDDNPDIMSEFLNQGEHQSIPVFVFYTRDHRYIAHWTERPAKANAELPEMMQLFAGKSREEARPLYEEFQHGPVWANWRRETVREILARIKEKCA